MNVVLLRHGLAAELSELSPRVGGPPLTDDDRPLTTRGRRRVDRAAKGLRRIGVRPDRILHSGLLRARETAELVAAVLAVPRARFEQTGALTPDSDPLALLRLLAKIEVEQVLCVGHAPNLDRVLAVACGVPNRCLSALGKAGAARLELPDSSGPGRPAGRIVWLFPPKTLRRLGT